MRTNQVSEDTQLDIKTEDKTKEWEPKIIGFLCNWCTYAGADLAGSSRLKYPANLRVVRVPCSGRVDPQFVLKALERGYDGVLVSGCHPGDCHYSKGNFYARRRLMLLKQLLEYLGIEPERFHFDWISASEGQKFSEVVSTFTEQIKRVGPFEGVGDKSEKPTS
jgi:coenzyme F420-reducing hydrogenase delta subunit